jgi:hypothetical protein
MTASARGSNSAKHCCQHGAGLVAGDFPVVAQRLNPSAFQAELGLTLMCFNWSERAKACQPEVLEHLVHRFRVEFVIAGRKGRHVQIRADRRAVESN